MRKQSPTNRKQFFVILALIIFCSILSFQHFELFHLLVAIYSIIIGSIIFIIVLNTNQLVSNNYYIFLGIAFGFIAIYEFIHTIYLPGVNISYFDSREIAAQIWYISRFSQSLAILLSFIFVNKVVKIKYLIATFLIYSILILSPILYFKINIFNYLPVLKLSGYQFQYSYLILIILIISLFVLNKRKITFSEFHYHNMTTAIIFFIIYELFFILPANFTSSANTFGHLTRLLSFYFIYRSIVVSGLKEPYNTIFYKLTKSNKRLSDLNQILNVVKNIHETINEDFELNNLFDKVVNILIKKEDYQMAFIGEYIKDNKELKIVSSVGVSSDFLKKETLDINKDNSAVTQAIKKRKIIRDYNPQAILNIFEKIDENVHNSLISLPIIYDGSVYGVLVISSYREEAFNDQVLEHLSKVTQNLGVAITRYFTQQKIRYMSFHDQLTGLYNKNFFNEEINRLDTSRKLPISIIVTDFNDLKQINDSYGHKTGDKFLKTYANILKKNSRQEDIIARWGGDEFVILLPNTNSETTEKLLDRLKQTVQKVEIKGEKMQIAFGYAVKEKPTQNIDEIFRQADQNMYHNKKVMKNNYRENQV